MDHAERIQELRLDIPGDILPTEPSLNVFHIPSTSQQAISDLVASLSRMQSLVVLPLLAPAVFFPVKHLASPRKLVHPVLPTLCRRPTSDGCRIVVAHKHPIGCTRRARN